MSYNDYMYAVDRSDEYLAHYGIKGMKWGIRKAIESGNARKLDRAYRKASKKLAKLEKRANSGTKYARRAAALGAGAAAAGGLAVAGTAGVSRALRSAGSTGAGLTRNVGNLMQKVGDAAYTYGRTPGNRNTKLGKLGTRYGKQLKTAGESVSKSAHEVSRTGRNAATAVAKWGNSNSIATGIAKNPVVNDLANRVQRNSFKKAMGPNGILNPNEIVKGVDKKASISKISNNTIARAGAAALGAGLAGAAGYNAYRAATTKRAAKKAAQFRSEMNKALAGTKYANGGTKKRRHR